MRTPKLIPLSKKRKLIMAWRLFIILMNNIEMGDFPIDLIYLSQHNASPIKMQFIV
jgi:hypothetical protein